MHRFAEISEIVFDGGAPQADEEQWFREKRSGGAGVAGLPEPAGADYDLDPLLVVSLLPDLLRTAARRRSQRARADGGRGSDHQRCVSLDRFFSLPARVPVPHA